MTDATIERISEEKEPHYEPMGWHHWPDDPWGSFQFRRALGETQSGGGTVSECFRTASLITPHDRDSWHREWLQLADRTRIRADRAKAAGHLHTARARYLRACNYYRSAEFWLGTTDPRRLETFTQCEAAFEAAGELFPRPVERVRIPYEDSSALHAYFIRPDRPVREPVPTVVSVGGLDSFKEELYFMIGAAVLERGMAALLVDGPGQGATLRRDGIPTRPDYEVPIGRCLDYLATRDDVDMSRVALTGTSIGGYYAARAGSYEHRLAAVVSHGGSWDLHEVFGGAGEDYRMGHHLKWVFGGDTVAEAAAKTEAFRLEGHLENMRCPYLIVHGGHAVFGTRMAEQAYEYAIRHGVDVQLHLTDEEGTGADHCQHDNPTVALELIGDWITDQLRLAQVTGSAGS